MMQSLIVSDSSKLPVFQLAPVAIQMRDEALAASALIGKVETADQNNECGNARKQIKGLLSLLESERRKATDPLLELQRTIKRDVDSIKLDLEKEDGRLENLSKDFIRAELRLKQEEEELQRRELARIEAERQAELDRIAREQAEAERKAREAAFTADKLAAEATSKAQREAAAAAKAEAERQVAAAAESARQQAQLAQERADAAAYIESKPVEIQRAHGQSVRKEWVIERINDFQLMKSRPDLVRKVEFDMVGIKQALASGEKLPGVTAREDISIQQRAGRALIEV